jgi:NOL1/NOP2/fmu family ribosome biogenesis protein
VVGLGKLVVGYDRKTKDKKGKIRISSEGIHFSSDFKKRIEKAMQSLISPDGKKGSVFDLSKEEFRAEVNSLVINNTYGEA